MSMTKLIVGSLLIGAACGAAATSVLYSSKIKSIQLDLNNAEIVRLNDEVAARNLAITTANLKLAELQQLNSTTQAKLTAYEEANQTLARNLATGSTTARVRIVPQACPSTAEGGDTQAGSMEHAGTAELDPAARQDYLALRLGIQRESEKVSYLQSYIIKHCQ